MGVGRPPRRRQHRPGPRPAVGAQQLRHVGLANLRARVEGADGLESRRWEPGPVDEVHVEPCAQVQPIPGQDYTGVPRDAGGGLVP